MGCYNARPEETMIGLALFGKRKCHSRFIEISRKAPQAGRKKKA
jgi:hypothetical protein